MLRKIITIILLCLTMSVGMAQTADVPSTVYFTSEITPEALVTIFRKLGVEPQGNVAVKISTGESAQSNHPHAPEMKDMGILASGDDSTALKERINSRHGTHTVEYAAGLSLGSLDYKIIDIDHNDK